MPPSLPSLHTLRQQIDAFDDQILHLLEQRTAVVEQVAEVKKSSNTAVFIKPNREAQIIRRLLSNPTKNSLQPIVIAQLWRDLMMASLQLECPFQVAVCGEETPTLLAARNHFGVATPLFSCRTMKEGLTAAASGTALLAVVPQQVLFENLTLLATFPTLKIVFRLPFVAVPDAPIFYALGAVPFEASGDDITVLLAENATDKKLSWVELEGFYEEHSSELAAAVHALPLGATTVRYLGGYARGRQTKRATDKEEDTVF